MLYNKSHQKASERNQKKKKLNPNLGWIKEWKNETENQLCFCSSCSASSNSYQFLERPRLVWKASLRIRTQVVSLGGKRRGKVKKGRPEERQEGPEEHSCTFHKLDFQGNIFSKLWSLWKKNFRSQHYLEVCPLFFLQSPELLNYRYL